MSDGAFSLEECKANAKLYATAPELLEACKAICSVNVYGKSLPTGMLEAMHMARAAIAKAEGREVSK